LFLVGEALIGKEPEIAHIDLIIGDKEGPVAAAFASGMASLSAGHTPLLGVIRPNLPPKPSTLIVPKVTVKNMEQAAQIFGRPRWLYPRLWPMQWLRGSSPGTELRSFW